MQAMPVLIGGMIWLIVAFIIQTGSKNKTWKDYDDSFAVWVGAVCAVGVGLFTLVSSWHDAWFGAVTVFRHTYLLIPV